MKKTSSLQAGGHVPQRRVSGGVAFALGLAVPLVLAAQAIPTNLAGSSLEELMNIEVTSVSKKEQKLSKTAAAVYVIGQEDIRRSGSTNIPDLLRMAPGLDVAQIAANQWAISIRGFNGLFSDKVLVLIDGRAVYVNTFSGVYWDDIDVPLENIERIEIIRGPGGTVWGANAMNGVINIITKNAADTKGGLITVGSGSKLSAAGLAQYGGHAGSNGAYRIFGEYANGENSLFPGGRGAFDGWHRFHEGFRSDWALSARDTLSVQGDVIAGDGGATTSVLLLGASPIQTTRNTSLNDTTGDVLARWDRSLANGSTSLQVYDSTIRRSESGDRLSNNVLDLNFEHHFAAGARHDIVWGLDYRSTRDTVQATAQSPTSFIPPSGTYSLFAGFVQDEIRLNRSLYLTLGSKLEHNAFTGLEYEPSAQLIWTHNDKHSLWASAARAIRQPGRSDYSVRYNFGLQPLPGGGTALISVNGNPAFKAERMHDYEIGYRGQATRQLSIDFTTFLSFYSRLQTTEPAAPFVSFEGGNPLLVLPLQFGNLAHARDYGFEIFANWSAARRWKLSPGYSSLHMRVTADPSSQDSSARLTPGASPRNQFELRSLLTLRKNVEWDTSYKYVTSLDSLGIPGYGRLDSRIGWHVLESMEISITGQNLATGRHLEFADNSGLFLQTEVARSVFAKFSWRM